MKLYNKAESKDLRRKLRKQLTDEERKVWQLLRNRRLLELKFFRQYGIGNYILDFYCPAIRLCIEIDGGQHAEDISKNYDEKRTNYLSSLNIKVIRFWNNEVNNNTAGIYEKIYNTTKQLILNSPRPSL